MKNFFILFSIICLSVILSTCKKESKQNPETDYIIYNNGEGSIGAGGGKITLNENNVQESSVSIDIPAGALTESEYISINVTPDALPNSPYSLGPIIELKPEGIIFNDSVKLTIKLNSPLNQDDNPIIFQYLPKRSYLKYNETHIESNNTISIDIKHFSLWTYVTHIDLRILLVQNFQVYIDNYPSKPIQNYDNIFALTKEDIMSAFSQWDYLTEKSFSLITNVDEANIAFQFTTQTEASDFYGGDPLGGGASAVAMWYLGDLNKRVILFNDDNTWASTEYLANNVKTILELPYQLNAEGVEFTAQHEIGHLFGLRHQQTEQNSNAVMTPNCPSLFPRALTCTDLEAFNSQYSNSCAVSLNSIGNLNIVAEPGSSVNDAIKIKVKDVNGNGVPGVIVMFYNDSNISLEFTKYTTTNISGDAYLSEMHVPQTEEKINIIVYAYLSDEMKSLTYTINKDIENPGSVTDIDGNVYNTVTIGTQVWMKENLKTTKYNDGTAIPNVTVDATWDGLHTGAYCDYGNTPAYSTIYGRLYKWFTVDNNTATKVASNGGKNVCPTSWHVPTDAEWTTLTTYLGGESPAGPKLRETGTTHWLTDYNSTNESGFTALPGGCRWINGTFHDIGTIGYWWSSTEYSMDGAFRAWFRNIWDVAGYANRNYLNKDEGLSVRCLKDN
jgi:uncharacterized protein (TIGR02145 family)